MMRSKYLVSVRVFDDEWNLLAAKDVYYGPDKLAACEAAGRLLELSLLDMLAIWPDVAFGPAGRLSRGVEIGELQEQVNDVTLSREDYACLPE